MTKIVLENVVKELKLLKVVVTVMVTVVTVQWSFLAVTNPVMTVNDHWPGVILSTVYVFYSFKLKQQDLII